MGAGGLFYGPVAGEKRGKICIIFEDGSKIEICPSDGKVEGGGSVPFEDGSPVGRCQMSEQLVCFHISKARVIIVLLFPPQNHNQTNTQ